MREQLVTSTTEHCPPHASRALSGSWTRRLLAFLPQLAKNRLPQLDPSHLPPYLLRDLGLGDPPCRDNPWHR